MQGRCSQSGQSAAVRSSTSSSGMRPAAARVIAAPAETASTSSAVSSQSVSSSPSAWWNTEPRIIGRLSGLTMAFATRV